MSKKQRQQVVIDLGPIERKRHNKVVVEQDVNNRARLRIVDQTEMDRLLWLRRISMDQHTAGEHLLRDINACGYNITCRWSPDSSITGDKQSISGTRSDALVKIGLARTWLLARAGRRITEYLFGVVIGERHVQDPQLPALRLGLDKYQSFEGWWHGRETEVPLPALLADLPGDVQLRRPTLY